MRNYSEAFHGRRSISYAAFVVLALMLAQPYALGIENFFTVDCANSAPGALQAAIDNLPAPPPGGQNFINLVSNCTENVTISGQHRLTISAGCIWCNPADPPLTITALNQGIAVIAILGSQGVSLENLILTGGSPGLSVGGGSSVNTNIIKVIGNYGGVTLGENSTMWFCDGGAVSNGGYAAIDVESSSSLILLGSTPWIPNSQPIRISGNTTIGIVVDRSYLQIGGGVIIEDNQDAQAGRTHPAGITAYGGMLHIGSWFEAPNFVRNNPNGIALLEGSKMVLYGPFSIEDNSNTGVVVAEGSGALFSRSPNGGPTIVGHGVAGVEVIKHSQAAFYGHTVVSNNGNNTEPLRAGIRVDGSSEVSMEGGTAVTGNIGPGIFADINSSLDVTDATISGNSEEGIRVRHMSIAEVQGSTTTAGNGGGPLVCDGTSLVITTLIAKTAKCANIEGAAGGPKPRTASTMRVAPNVMFMMQQARRAAERFKAPK